MELDTNRYFAPLIRYRSRGDPRVPELASARLAMSEDALIADAFTADAFTADAFTADASAIPVRGYGAIRGATFGRVTREAQYRCQTTL